MNDLEYELYLKSKDFFVNDQVDEAIKILEELSKKHNVCALFDLGMLYFKGEKVKKNIKKAYNLLLFSADLGYSEAYYQLGLLCYYELRDFENANRFLAKSKFLKSIFVLGKLHYEYQRYEKAFEYFLIASKNNNKMADYYLANCYLEGKGTKKNYILAETYYKKSINSIEEDIFNLKKIFSYEIVKQ